MPVIDSTFEHVTPSGAHVGGLWSYAEEYDTSATGVITVRNSYYSFNICNGECIKLHGHGEYESSSGASDTTSTFTWVMGDNTTYSDVNLTTVEHCYSEPGCYEVSLSIKDQLGNVSSIYVNAKVRIAINPIKTISPIETICSNDSVLLIAAFDDSIGQLSLTHLAHRSSVSHEYDAKTFIPDGPNCAVECYEAPVTFSEFPVGQTIQSAEEICSICINYEHSYMGDYRLSIICPNNSQSVLKYADDYHDPIFDDYTLSQSLPYGSYGGGSIYAGIPYGGYNDYSWDGSYGSQYCDTAYNMYGDGRNYCFSRSGDYTLVDGRAADVPQYNQSTPTYLGNDDGTYEISLSNYQFTTVPAGYNDAGQRASSSSFDIKRPSDHDNKSDYYTPHSDFHELIGCPMNGTWKIQICDYWAQDNGWVFSWSLDLCNIQQQDECRYTVDIDSVVWSADTTHSSHTGDEYRGLVMNKVDSTSVWMHAKDTAGVFPVNVTVYDQFGCQWDTSTSVHIIALPSNLNKAGDTIICEASTAHITVSSSDGSQYQYKWFEQYDQAGEPAISNGADLSIALPQETTDKTYYVMATTATAPYCSSWDSVTIHTFHPTIGQSDSATCTGGEVSLWGDNAYGYRWSSTPYDPTLDGQQQSQNITVKPSTTTTYSLIGIGNNSCESAPLNAIVNVLPYPSLSVDFSPDIITSGDRTVIFSDNSLYSEFSLWNIDGEQLSGNPLIYTFNSLSSEIVDVTLVSSNALGCSSDTTFHIPVETTEVWIPDVITPYRNTNKVFKVSSSKPLENFVIYIYDRRGALLFTSEDPNFTWNATVNGHNCPQGVYVYICRYRKPLKADLITQTGTITVLH